MKNRIPEIFVMASSVAMAAGAIYADLKKGYYTPDPLGSIEQAAPATLSTDDEYEVSAYPVLTLELARGDGLQDVQIYCNACHSPRYITMQPPLPAATWEAEVTKMNKAYGAGIPEDTARKITEYLEAHYTPETRKR